MITQSKGWLWTGRLTSALITLFMLLDGIGKLARPAAVVEGTVQIGYPESCLVGLGIVLILCTIAYAIPRSSVLGAILLTGYLGGATASQVRVSAGWVTVLLPVLMGVLVWGGLFLRDPELRSLIPLRRAS